MRDIITTADVAALNEEAALAEAGDVADAGPGGRLLGGRSGATHARVPAPDSWNQRLMKYIPGESLGLYLALDRAVHSVGPLQAAEQQPTLAFWLAVVLVVSAIFNVLYLRIVWSMARVSQIAVSTLALLAYAYATGGTFEAMKLTEPSVQMIVVILAGAVMVFFEPPGRVKKLARERNQADVLK